MTADERDYSDKIQTEVRRVLLQYANLKPYFSDSVSLPSVLRAIGEANIPGIRTVGDARCWVLTMDMVANRVNRAIGNRNAVEAVGQRLCIGRDGMPWRKVAQLVLHVSEVRAKEIVDEATALLMAEFLARDITENFKATEAVA